MNGNKTPWVFIALAGLCLLCLVPALALGSMAGNRAGDAVTAALARDGGADSDQEVTAVCVGLNIGSCRTEQEQTETPTQTERRDAGGNPWPVIVLSIVMLLIAQYLVLDKLDPWGLKR